MKMSTEKKAAQIAPFGTTNPVAALTEWITTGFGRIDPHFDPNNPTFKMLTAGYFLHLASTVKDVQLKATLQKEAIRLF